MPPLFLEATQQTGLDFVHFNGMSGEFYLAEITCGGAALLDFDQDGDLDIYFPQGAMLGPGKTLATALLPPQHPLPLTDRLYRNDLTQIDDTQADDGQPALRFTDVTDEAGLLPSGYGCGATTGDFDNDGWVDLYLHQLGANRLLRNRGDGTFEDVTEQAGVGDPRSSVAALFLDFDRDGWLDLFVANNLAFDFSPNARCFNLSGAPDWCGPTSFPAEPDRLLHNRGDGTFEDVTEQAGLGAALGPALGAVAADFDDDGWVDLYVANDGQANNLWKNQGDGTFRDEALLAGCAVNEAGKAEASMGVDAADFDADGDLDLFLTHLLKETNTLYRNDGGGNFLDITSRSGLGAPSLSFTSFGTSWLDANNDGHLDLFVANGAVVKLPALERQGDPFPLHQPNQLFLGRRNGPFQEVSTAQLPILAHSQVSRGTAFGDLDNDGDTDVLVINNGGPASLLLNTTFGTRQGGTRQGRPSQGKASWIGLRLLDASGRRDQLGARVALLRNGQVVAWERVAVDGSYGSANDPRVLFAADPDASHGVRVIWPDGTIEAFTKLPAGSYSELRQGSGQVVQP